MPRCHRPPCRNFLRGRLANFKVPKDIQFMDAMPREATGKIFKRKLRDLHTEEQAAARWGEKLSPASVIASASKHPSRRTRS